MDALGAIGAWIAEHSAVLNVAINVAMLAVWILYFHLLLVTYRRQTRPNILINRGPGHDLGSSCLISNMSERPIYIQAVIVRCLAGERTWEHVISDMGQHYERNDKPGPSTAEQQQGPLSPGEFVDFGSFETLLTAVPGDNFAPRDIDALEITVAAVYTARADVIGARRRFTLKQEGTDIKVESEGVLARQITRRAEKMALLASLG